MSASEIYNFVQINDLIATAGQPSADQFRELRDAGYECVINLAPDGLETSLAGESELLASLGIAYRHIPVAWNAPGLDDLQAFEEALAATSGKPTLIHCQANYRVTAFFALHAQANLGWDEDRADALIDRIWNANAGYEMDATWKAFIVAARQRLREDDC